MVLALCMSSLVTKYLYEVSRIYHEQFISYRADTILSRTSYIKSSKGCNSKSIIWFLCSEHQLMLVNICMKIHEDTLTVLNLQSGHDLVTELLITNFKGT